MRQIRAPGNSRHSPRWRPQNTEEMQVAPDSSPAPLSLTDLLGRLEKFHGPQEPGFPVDPYQFLIWWLCGYPASDAACAKGWSALKSSVGIEPAQLLRASPAVLAAALKHGGMVPELRALRLKEVAERVLNEYGGDLRSGLVGPIVSVRKALKQFPNIADPGADRILLFGRIAPVAAVPSNCPHVLTRIDLGRDDQTYSDQYRHAQQRIEAEVPAQFHARSRAYLLLKAHGQTICKRTKPKCAECPVNANCVYPARAAVGRAGPGKS